jgi:hypothetical protein
MPGLSALTVRDSAGVLLVQANGLQARLRGVTADTAGATIMVHPARARP